MAGSSKADGDGRSYDALEDMLDLQRRIMETTREMNWLVQRSRVAVATERMKLRWQLEEITAILTEYAQQVSDLSARYRSGE